MVGEGKDLDPTISTDTMTDMLHQISLQETLEELTSSSDISCLTETIFLPAAQITPNEEGQQLIKVMVEIGGMKTKVLVDSGLSSNFMSASFVHDNTPAFNLHPLTTPSTL
ncbi:hypothetical protein NEOLI_005189 [Neolecta irregularis DAH-3]|uniref:Uncharacterized protein n=1 Tax=Neolecta irregularis (strain DAH-3) TaxID=1198029 RepID=A0A1U7LNE8_NEOID|nr:hypothetical protein NEOLI_005189 [Neolecta irregularis DAH-3]|eukprot:OLL24159.1 hypothetical protein NEOLI_005189 [Neolecta irregularis DAH-3]